MLGDDWNERYAHIIELGKAMPPLPVEYQTEENKIKGCQSSVWIISSLNDGRIQFKGDSDALIVKGLVSLVLRVFNNRTTDEILQLQPSFMQRIGLDSHLSPTRNNGLAAMMKQMKFYALAYKTKMQSHE